MGYMFRVRVRVRVRLGQGLDCNGTVLQLLGGKKGKVQASYIKV